jgi:hypothetical protein
MYRLINNYARQLAITLVARFTARHLLLTGCDFSDPPTVKPVKEAISRFKHGDTRTVEAVFAAGHELEGYEQLWGDSSYLHPKWRLCIDVYLDVTSRARTAALQTIVALKAVRLGRDVAVLIGKTVYGTRRDARAWWWRQKSDSLSTTTTIKKARLE